MIDCLLASIRIKERVCWLRVIKSFQSNKLCNVWSPIFQDHSSRQFNLFKLSVYAQFLILSTPIKFQNISKYDSDYFLCHQSLSADGHLYLNSFYTGPLKAVSRLKTRISRKPGYLGLFLSDFLRIRLFEILFVFPKLWHNWKFISLACSQASLYTKTKNLDPQ